MQLKILGWRMKNHIVIFAVICSLFCLWIPVIGLIFHKGALPAEQEQVYGYCMVIAKIIFSLVNVFPALIILNELVSKNTRELVLICRQNRVLKQVFLLFGIMCVLCIVMMLMIDLIYRGYIDRSIHFKTLIELLISLWFCNSICVTISGFGKNVFIAIMINTLYALLFCLMHISGADFINVYSLENYSGIFWGIRVIFFSVVGGVLWMIARRCYQLAV